MQGYNRSSGEYGPSPREQRSIDEQGATNEQLGANELHSFSETGTSEPTPQRKTVRSQKNSSLMSRLLSTALAASLTVVTVGAIAPALKDMVIAEERPVIETAELGSTEHALQYRFFLKNAEDLDVILYDDARLTNRRAELVEGENVGLFDQLVSGKGYTVSIVEPGLLGEQALASWQMKTKPHPIDAVEGRITEAGADLNTVYYTVSAKSDQPLWMVLSSENFREEQLLTDDFQAEGFHDVPMGALYTLSLMGEGPVGPMELHSVTVEVPHPIVYTTASLSEVAADGTEIHYSIHVQSVVPLGGLGLRLSLYQGDTLIDSAPLGARENLSVDTPWDPDATEAAVNGRFTGLVQGGTYTLIVSAPEGSGERELARQEIDLPQE